jgi:hypothetical protein
MRFAFPRYMRRRSSSWRLLIPVLVMACHDRDLIGLPGVKRMKLRDGHLEYK